MENWTGRRSPGLHAEEVQTAVSVVDGVITLLEF